MSFLATLVLVGAAGLGLLDLLRLRTCNRLADAGLAWLVGCGWYGLAAMALRFGLGVPYRAATALAIALSPGVFALALRRLRPVRPLDGPSARGITPDAAAGSGDGLARWLPRPWKFWLPVIAYVIAVTMVIVLHGINTPTHTDDAIRVRAYTPFLALEDDWPRAARGLLVAAGALPTFVPTVSWVLTGSTDHFHVNYTVLAHLVAFLALAVGLGVRSRRPQRGWATAFAVLSLPFLVYHLTSTYQDAVVALFAGATLLFVLEYARSGDTVDAARAFLLAAALAMVKRDGLVVGATLAAALLAHLVLRRRRERIPVLMPALHALAPAALYGILTIASAGRELVAPIVAQGIAHLESAAIEVGASATSLGWRAARGFGEALWQRGHAGMLYWALPLAVVVRWRSVLCPAHAGPLVAALFVLAETAVASIWLIPEYTINGSTVHRALLSPSVLLAIWLAALLTADCRKAT